MCRIHAHIVKRGQVAFARWRRADMSQLDPTPPLRTRAPLYRSAHSPCRRSAYAGPQVARRAGLNSPPYDAPIFAIITSLACLACAYDVDLYKRLYPSLFTSRTQGRHARDARGGHEGRGLARDHTSGGLPNMAWTAARFARWTSPSRAYRRNMLRFTSNFVGHPP